MVAGVDVEFAVGAGEVVADGFGGDEQCLGDVTVAQGLRGQSGDPELAGGQGLDAGGPGSAGAGAGGQCLVASARS